MSNYKSFDINDNLTPAPWGAREQKAIEDIIDTSVVGTLEGAKQATGGHQHNQICLAAGIAGLDVNSNVNIIPVVKSNSSGDVVISPSDASSTTSDIIISTDASGNKTISTAGSFELECTTNGGSGAKVTLNTLDKNDASHLVEFSSDSGNRVYFSTASSDTLIEQSSTITLTATTHVTINCTGMTITSLPASSAGLTTGMLWNSSGTVKVI
jgi:hypothetical protein